MATVNLAASEKAFNTLVMAAAKKLESMPPFSGNGNAGPFSASYQIGFKITDGEIDLKSNGRVHIKELDVTYDPFILNLGLDIPTWSFGGQCIIRNPVNGNCIVRLPRIDLFTANPDISVPINLSGLIVSEFSGEFSIRQALQVLAAKGSRTDHQAHAAADTSNEIRNRFRTIISSIPLLPASAVNSLADALVPFVKSNLADKEQFFLTDHWHDLDIIDIADTAVNILQGLVEAIIDIILAPVPAALRDVLKAILSPLFDFIRDVLDIGDDIFEWLSSLLGTSFGLLDILSQIIINFLGTMVPFYQLENPYPAIQDTSGLIPVLVPLGALAGTVDDQEFTLSADIL